MTDLCSLADVKEYLNTGQQPYPPTDDRLLSRLITACSVQIQSWISRPLGLANWQEIRTGVGGERGGYYLSLAMTPVINILSLTIDGFVVPPAPSMQPTSRFTAGYLFTPTEIQLNGYFFARGTRIEAQYTAGYNPIPADIQQACIEAVSRKYRERTRIAEHSRSLGGAETVAYSTVMFSRRDFATDIDAVLAYYRQSLPLFRPTLLPTPPTPLILEDGGAIIELEDAATPVTAEATTGGSAAGSAAPPMAPTPPPSPY